MKVTPITGEPLYPVPYAATLAGLDRRTAQRWLRGYAFTRNGERRQSAPVVPRPWLAEAASIALWVGGMDEPAGDAPARPGAGL